MNLQESIRRILREELNESIFFRRRINLDEVKKLLPIHAEQVYGETKSYEQFKYELTLRAVEAIMWNNYELGWEDLPEQEEIEFVNEVSKMFNKTIKKLYNSYSGRILREEVKKKFPKPSDNINNAVYKWLDNYFEGSQIYKHESWKHWSYSFEFCKNGREIAFLHVDFDDKSPDWGPRDKRPTSERSFKESKLFIYPYMIDIMKKVFPIRKNYLLYLIEEWFEDTKLDDIQQEFNRNDFSLDKVIVFDSRNKGELCVPPVSKPEGVTMQEMMDLIKKTTLYSYKDMEKKEEKEPGWIEELYLAKLHGKEKERLNQEDRENNPEPFNDDY